MSGAYFPRLCCLSLATLFLVQNAIGLAAKAVLPGLIARAASLAPRRAAALLLAVRWMPAGLGVLLVVVLGVPSYLRLEPQTSPEEEIGFVCSSLALACLLSYAVPGFRAVYRVVRTELLLRSLVAVDGRICVLEQPGPGMALAGLFGWRLLVSRQVMGVLSADEMAVALRHEQAHQKFQDNFARALLEAAPVCALPGAELHAAWIRFTEWAADDWAVEGDEARPASLALALIRVARLGGNAMASASPLVTGDPDLLRERVDRLLQPSRAYARISLMRTSAILLVAAGVLACAARSDAVLSVIHRCQEILIG